MMINKLLAGISFIFLSFFLAGCDDKNLNETPKLSHKTWSLPVAVVEMADIPKYYVATGSVVSDHRIAITSRITGFIQQIMVLEGASITKGQLLISLDSSNIDGVIKQAQATQNIAALTFKDSKADVKRAQYLFKLKSISGEKLRKVKLQHDVANDALHKADAALMKAQQQRKYMNLTSPINGTVVIRHQREGDLAIPGSPILTIESNTGLLFETTVPAKQFAHIESGSKIKIKIDALDDNLIGVVTRMVASADLLTRNFVIKMTLPEHVGLLSGMFGRSYFHIKTEQATVIPVSALIERGGLQGVFVLDELDHAYFRWLRIGKTSNKQLEILSGLNGGERIIINPHQHIHEGDIIDVQHEGGRIE